MEATNIAVNNVAGTVGVNMPGTQGPQGVNMGYGGSSRSASLYVGDLAPNTTESQLFEAFSQIGKIQSIRILRDAITRQSLGYAYVNYYDAMDADRAIEILNFSSINGRPCRVMWVERDPSRRKSGVGNVVIKNLHPDIDNKSLYDLFSQWGNILSCKVATDDKGESKGFGFVHFDSEASARHCIELVNGKEISDKIVTVEAFVKERRTVDKWTNLYVKNIPLDWDDAKLRENFAKFGEITSAVVSMHSGEDARAKGLEGRSKGFGYVNFASHDEAVAAMGEMDGKKFMDGEQEKELYVRRMQSRKERQKELREKFAQIKKDRMTKFQGCNVYIKNLDERANDDWLRQNFGKYGTITSARIMRDLNGVSRGFGFVCFSQPEEAQQAIQKMHNQMFFGKPIFVALSQTAQARREMLAVSFQTQQQQQRGMMPPLQHGAPFYPPPSVMQQPYLGLGAPYNPMQRANMLRQGAMPVPNMGGLRGPMQPYRMPDYQRRNDNILDAQQRQPKPYGGRGRAGRGGSRLMGQPPQMAMQVMAQPVAPTEQPPLVVPQTYPDQAGPEPPRQGGLDHVRLASASVEEQKTILGESLYPLIYTRQPEQAGKITGMILELDNTEILHLLESPEALDEKVNEAIQVLEDYKRGPSKDGAE